MRCKHFKRLLSVWTCTSAIALLSSSAAFAQLARHPIIQTLEATHEEIQPDPEEMPQSLKFGLAVAIRDGTAFVGMPEAFDHGRVAIFTQTASGWQRTGTLDPSPENGFEADFGRSLAFRDGYVMVGTTQSVYVFKRGNGRWNLSQRLAAPAGEFDFAGALHFEGGVLVVGAPKRTSNRLHGTAYVYERNAAGMFALRATLEPTDSQIGDAFGFDVSVASGVIVIGAPESAAGGAAYVFRRNSSGAWVQRQRLVSTEAETGDAFGAAVAIDKSMIVVGAPNVDFEDSSSTPDGHMAGGAAYGFVPVAGSFVETFKLRPRPDENPDYYLFGTDVAMFDKRIAVSAAQFHLNFIDGGYVHTYRRDGSSVGALGLAEGFFMGDSNTVALANQWLLVGVPYDSSCFSSIGICIGEANVVDLSKFVQ
jgi:hypothetical protein